MSISKKILPLCLALLIVIGCGGRQPREQLKESAEAKRLAQGVWMDEDTETAVFQMKGDTVYYSDSTSLPAYFRVVGDTLYVGSMVRYAIERQTEHLLWLKGSSGEVEKYVKSDDTEMQQVFSKTKQDILKLSAVLKRDTVVFWNANRYHIYIAVNPTKYKVTRHTFNEDGLDVESVYYDNIVHISVYQGARQLFSRDFRKQLYQPNVPEQVFAVSILNNIEYDKTDAMGFHFRASVCVPDDASCYMVGHTIGFDGKMTTQLLEF